MGAAMFRAICGVVLGVALIGPAAAKPAPIVPIELTRVGKWEMNYDKDSCHLYGQFGEGDARLVISLTRYSLGQVMELRAYGKSLKVSGQFFTSSVDFGPTVNPVKGMSLIGTSGDLTMVIFGGVRLDDWTSKDPNAIGPEISPADEAKVTDLTFLAPNKKWYRLKFDAMGKAMSAMRTCTSNLIKSWGYDPATMVTLKSAPQPITSPGTWLTTNDYPTNMVRQGGNGLVQFRLDIDKAGSVTGCHILARTSPDEFSDVTCKLLQRRAKFAPAIDSQGNRVAAFYVNSVRWMMPH